MACSSFTSSLSASYYVLSRILGYCNSCYFDFVNDVLFVWQINDFIVIIMNELFKCFVWNSLLSFLSRWIRRVSLHTSITVQNKNLHGKLSKYCQLLKGHYLSYQTWQNAFGIYVFFSPNSVPKDQILSLMKPQANNTNNLNFLWLLYSPLTMVKA